MDMQECKVFFHKDVTRERADELLSRYSPKAKIDTFVFQREIGCNTVTFAVITMGSKEMVRLQEEKEVLRIDPIQAVKGKACKAEECPPSG